jgi:hypothetical protein
MLNKYITKSNKKFYIFYILVIHKFIGDSNSLRIKKMKIYLLNKIPKIDTYLNSSMKSLMLE